MAGLAAARRWCMRVVTGNRRLLTHAGAAIAVDRRTARAQSVMIAHTLARGAAMSMLALIATASSPAAGVTAINGAALWCPAPAAAAGAA
ncbi:MAG: hypothetical protein P8Y53_08940 [Pseudolabrys sp.]